MSSKPIPGHPGYYCDESGRIWSDHSNRYKKLSLNKKNGYVYVSLSDPGSKTGNKICSVHVLVATLFVPNPNPQKNIVVNHIDLNRQNNHYTNLEWTTVLKNSRHTAIFGRTGKFKLTKAERIRLLKMYNADPTGEVSKELGRKVLLHWARRYKLKICEPLPPWEMNRDDILQLIDDIEKHKEQMRHFGFKKGEIRLKLNFALKYDITYDTVRKWIKHIKRSL